MNQKVTILYDSECMMCARFKKGLELMDKNSKITFYSIHDPKTFELFPSINPKEARSIVHLIKDDKTYKGGEAISELIKIYPGVNKLVWLLDSQAGKKAMDLFYTKIDELKKSRLNPCPKCKESTPE